MRTFRANDKSRYIIGDDDIMGDEASVRKFAKALASIEGYPTDDIIKDFDLVRVDKGPKGNVCPHCGSMVKEGSKFCDNCWEKI